MKSIPINEILREKRLKEGITLEQVFYDIHIPSKFVCMIEDGRWEKFPSQLHMKGFIRIYGEYLKIPASVIEEGIKTIEKEKEEEKKQDEMEQKEREEPVLDRSIYILLLLLVFFVILYFLVLYILPE